MLLDRILFSSDVPALMKKSLDFNSARHLLISSNISNVDTPGYKAHDLDFSEQLRWVMNTGSSMSLKATHPTHFMASSAALKGLQPIPFATEDISKSNGNNVNMDKEMAHLAENQIRYSAVSQLMMKRGSTIRSAILEVA